MTTRSLFSSAIRMTAMATLIFCMTACGGGASSAEQPQSTPSQAQEAQEAPKAIEEPSEGEMRALYVAKLDEINRSGGANIQMSGGQSDSFGVKVESFRKLGCKPLGNNFRCEADVRTSYPGIDLPDDTAVETITYRKDAEGRWTSM